MFTLIAIGVGAAFVFSAVAMLPEPPFGYLIAATPKSNFLPINPARGGVNTP